MASRSRNVDVRATRRFGHGMIPQVAAGAGRSGNGRPGREIHRRYDRGRPAPRAEDPGAGHSGGAPAVLSGRKRGYFLPAALPSPESEERAAMKASCGTSTRPTIFIRFLPSFCFSSSLRFRLMSPP